MAKYRLTDAQRKDVEAVAESVWVIGAKFAASGGRNGLSDDDVLSLAGEALCRAVVARDSKPEEVWTLSTYADWQMRSLLHTAGVAARTRRRFGAAAGEFKEFMAWRTPSHGGQEEFERLVAASDPGGSYPIRRDILRLVYYEGLSHKEAAARLGLSGNSFRHHLYAALEEARRTLSDCKELLCD